MAELEEGTGTGLVGALGDGTGRWHLSISANRRIRVMSLLSGPGGRLANLSTAPSGTMGGFSDAPEGSGDTVTAVEVFSEHISERVVHSRCIYCHVEDGRSGHTRLVFEQTTTEDHEALNLETFENFLSEVESGASRILNKIQGVSHGGGEQVPADSDDFAQMERFLEALEGPSEVFSRHISERVVQSRCIYCHVPGGRSGHTRLVFEQSTTEGHEALNLATFENFLSEVESGASRILNKIQGVSHGGGEQVPADSEDFAQMERFLSGLDAGVVPAAITVETLFDPVRMAPLRKTFRRAALIFAGRVPTEEEYASIYGGARAFRTAIRNLMTGPEFHEFLIRGANDRLLTDRDDFGIIDRHNFADHTNEIYRRRKAARTTGDSRSVGDWYDKVEHGARRAPLELIAHVVENDLPYTEILTADYIMANPYAARAYETSTTFDDPDDPYEFRPTKIVSYYLEGEEFEKEYDVILGARVIDPGPLRIDYPHAGILNTTMFLRRYPTTATNRNRARARWTYYHFLGVDIEKSASRTTDPVALADTNNPTMHNPACTVCHSVLDPVAGAFQDYGDEGFYKDQWGGMDSLHNSYKEPEDEIFQVEGDSWETRQTFSITAWMNQGSSLFIRHMNNNYCDDTGCGTLGRDFRLDQISVRDVATGALVHDISWDHLDEHCLHDGRYNSETGTDDHYQWWGWNCAIPLNIPSGANYLIEVVTWADRAGDELAKIGLGARLYQEGDTWYRDMRSPGFSEGQAPEGEDSLRWLAQQIVEDRRFAEAAVKFWWPAIMGNEVAEPPGEEGDADFEGMLLAANAQSSEVRRLAHGFRQGFQGASAYNLKDLLVEMVLSKWFRADTLSEAEPVRKVALRDTGARRLLTPEELARKTLALTGYQFGRRINPNCGGPCEALSYKLTDDFLLLYGGIDSDGITERARDMTTVMAGVAKRYAVRTSCPVVLRELFVLPDEDRKLFAGIDRNVTQVSEFGDTFEITAASRSEMETLFLQGRLAAGEKTVTIAFLNDYWHETRGDRNVLMDRLTVRQGSTVVFHYEMENLDHRPRCHHMEQDAFHLSGSGPGCVLAVPVDIPSDGAYQIELSAWATQAGDELPKLSVIVESDAEGLGASVIRDKLVELHEKLLGIETTPYSADVEAAFSLFVDVMERGQGLEETHFHWWECGFNDIYFFEGILDDIVIEKRDEWGHPYDYHFDNDRVDALWESTDFSDIHYGARTWVVVLAYLMTDYRYLQL